MGIIIDIIIVLIIALSAFLGYKKGLTKSFLKIFSFLIALVISIVLFKPLSNIVINNTQIDENLKNSIVSKFNQNSEEDVEEESKNSENENNMPAIFNEYIEKEINKATNEAKQIIIEESAKQIAVVIINIGVVIIVFILSRIILIFVKGLANLITKMPIIKQCDELGGLIYGILRAALILLIVFTIMSLLAPVIENFGIITMVNSSVIGRILYNNNILFSIIF